MEKNKACSGPCKWLGIVIIGLGLLAAFVSLHGCAGPSKSRYKQLLQECRIANRERARMIETMSGKGWHCENVPEQTMGTVDFNEGGH